MSDHNETQVWPERPRRRWQNLLHQKCPNCDTRLQDKGHYLICPQQLIEQPGRNCFFIKKEIAAACLLNPNHPANFCLSPHERARVEEAIAQFGIDPSFIKKQQ